MDKNKEILDKQKKQSLLKKEIKYIKKKLPSYIISFIFFIAISLYFLEDKFYNFFGNNVNLIIGIVIFLCIFFLFFIFRSFHIIKRKKQESKAIGIQLYHIMKLEVSTKNE